MSDKKEIHRVFLIADLSGYTALTEAHGNISAAQIVHRYIEIVQEILDEGAQIAETVGDEVLIVGKDAAQIVQIALDLRDKVEKEPNFPTLHIGIHAGHVLEKEGRFFGSALNITARVASYARADQILCTNSVIEMLSERNAIKYCELGEVNFKNLIEPIPLLKYQMTTIKSILLRTPFAECGLSQTTPLHAYLTKARSTSFALSNAPKLLSVGRTNIQMAEVASKVTPKKGTWLIDRHLSIIHFIQLLLFLALFSLSWNIMKS